MKNPAVSQLAGERRSKIVHIGMELGSKSAAKIITRLGQELEPLLQEAQKSLAIMLEYRLLLSDAEREQMEFLAGEISRWK